MTLNVLILYLINTWNPHWITAHRYPILFLAINLIVRYTIRWITCTSLSYIIFGCDFNCSISNLLNNCPSLFHLDLGYKFNQKLNLPYNISSLSLNSYNAKLVDYLSDNIEELELGHIFNLELDNLPSLIKKYHFTNQVITKKN